MSLRRKAPKTGQPNMPRMPRMPTFAAMSTSPRRPVGRRADPTVLNLLHEAIGERAQIKAMYIDEDGRTDEHTFFPIELGVKGRVPRVWAYQTAGGSGVGWRCFFVGWLSNVTSQPAAWTVPDELPDSARCLGQNQARAR